MLGEEEEEEEAEQDDGCDELGLSNTVNFPTFRNIPDENDVDCHPYLALADHVCTQRMHWCLMGEIVDISTFIRPRLDVRDRKGAVFRVHMHVTDRSSTLRPEDVMCSSTIGHVIAILLPEKHHFQDFSVGIRHEHSDTAYVFKASFAQLLRESNRLMTSPNKCFHCCNDSVIRCQMCQLATYCSESCSKAHWNAVHNALCSQMLVLSNLLKLDFTRQPCGDATTFVELSRAPARVHLNGGRMLHVVPRSLPRSCVCGFRDTDLTNSHDCPGLGLESHLDFPPATCLPGAGQRRDECANSQFYYSSEGLPFRHWAIVAEVLAVHMDRIDAETKFGESVRFLMDPSWRKLKVQPGNCIVGFYATLVDVDHAGVHTIATQAQEHVVTFGTSIGLDALLNAQAAILERLAQNEIDVEISLEVAQCRPIVRHNLEGLEALTGAESRVLETLTLRSVRGHCRNWHDRGCISAVDLWTSKSLETLSREGSGSVRKDAAVAGQPQSGRTGQAESPSPSSAAPDSPLARFASALQAVLIEHPSGLPGGRLPREFEAIHGTRPNPKALGFKTLRKLLEACPGMEVSTRTTGAGTDMWIQLKMAPDSADKASAPNSSDRSGARATPSNKTSGKVRAGKEGASNKPQQCLPARLGPRHLAPSSIYFTHDSIKSVFTDGRPLKETLQQLKDREIAPTDIPAMQVCWQAGNGVGERFWTYTGNRRLWVFKQLEASGMLRNIEVQVVDKKVKPWRMTTRDGGQTVRIRGGAAPMPV